MEIRVAPYPSGAPEFTPVEIRVVPYPSGAPEFTPVEIRVASYPSGAPELTLWRFVFLLILPEHLSSPL